MSYPTKAERDAARKVLEQCAALGKTVLGDWREWSGVTLAVQTGQLSNSMEARMTLSAIDTCIDLLKRDPDMRFKALAAELGGKLNGEGDGT